MSPVEAYIRANNKGNSNTRVQLLQAFRLGWYGYHMSRSIAGEMATKDKQTDSQTDGRTDARTDERTHIKCCMA